MIPYPIILFLLTITLAWALKPVKAPQCEDVLIINGDQEYGYDLTGVDCVTGDTHVVHKDWIDFNKHGGIED